MRVTGNHAIPGAKSTLPVASAQRIATVEAGEVLCWRALKVRETTGMHVVKRQVRVTNKHAISGAKSTNPSVSNAIQTAVAIVIE